MATPLLELRGLGKSFEAAGETGAAVLRGIDLEIGAAETLAVVGPSGSGKSTLLNLIGGLLPPTAGTILFRGRDLGDMRDAETAAYRNQEIGFVFQAHHLLPQCTALENVLVPTLVCGDPSSRAHGRERAGALLESVGLGDKAMRFPAQLSGGECQRVAVVRALVNSPSVILADEPTGSLDAEASAQLGEQLLVLNDQEKVALVLVTHSDALAQRMQRVFRLEHGRLEEVRSQP